MRALASTLEGEVFGRLIGGLVRAALDGASEPVPVLIERLRRLEKQARADGLSRRTIHAIASGRQSLGDTSAI
ncbi:hypothetical protein [Methylobacterium nigriterrae]|uniref:hypothetical protein n=1 Tax=Methylobacterium nigriterrae TaxID=3127512 RepID=UPI0030135E71